MFEINKWNEIDRAIAQAQRSIDNAFARSADARADKELALKISHLFNYKGLIVWDKKKPDGTPRKLLNIKKIKDLGWEPKITLEEGIKAAIESFKTENKY